MPTAPNSKLNLAALVPTPTLFRLVLYNPPVTCVHPEAGILKLVNPEPSPLKLFAVITPAIFVPPTT